MGDNNFQAEFGAHLRSAAGDPLLAALKNVKFRENSPDEQFIILVDSIFLKLIENGLSFISEYDKEFIMNNISKLDKPGSKNATGYILGYYASKYDKTMEMVFDSLDMINSLSSQYPVLKINKPDVIRYARLWNTLI